MCRDLYWKMEIQYFVTYGICEHLEPCKLVVETNIKKKIIQIHVTLNTSVAIVKN